MRSLLPLLLLLLTTTLPAQFKLVTDYNPGPGDAFECFLCKEQLGVDLNGGRLLVAMTDETGFEPTLFKDDQLTLLKDINPGSKDARIEFFKTFEDKVYFRALDPVNGSAIWVTDGTPEGTMLYFDPDIENTEDFIADFDFSNDGALYVVLNKRMYRFKDGQRSSFEREVTMPSTNSLTKTAIIPYRDGIVYTSSTSVENGGGVFYVTDEIVRIATIDGQDLFDSINGLRVIGDDLYFNNSSSSLTPERSGTYRYEGESGKVSGIKTADGKNISVEQWIDDGSDIILFKLLNDLYRLTEDGTARLLHTPREYGRTNTDDIPWARKDSLLFWPSVFQPFGGPQVVSVTNVNTGETTSIFEELTTTESNFLISGDHLFFYSGRGAFANVKYFRYRISTGELTKVFEGADNFRILFNRQQLIKVENDKLYVATDVDEAVGYELYTLTLDLNLSPTSNFRKVSELDVVMQGQSFIVNSPLAAPVRVSVYTVGGQLMRQFEARPNASVSLENVSGMHLLYFEQEGRAAVRKFVGR